MKDQEEELNKLRVENEIKKMKLTLGHGVNFPSTSENNLSPELESQWLDYIQKFEDSFAKNNCVKIYDFVGKPVFKLVDEISETEIEFELNRILNLLGQKGIELHTICEVSNRELYRFITEELLFEETNDMMIEGMTQNYIYEEFHPNHEHDLETRCNEFIADILNKERNLNSDFMAISNEIHTDNGSINQEDFVKRLELFREAFSSFHLQQFMITALKIDEDMADVSFDINYSGIIEGAKENITFKGSCGFKLKYEHDYWCITQINIPGIHI